MSVDAHAADLLSAYATLPVDAADDERMRQSVTDLKQSHADIAAGRVEGLAEALRGIAGELGLNLKR